MASFPPIQLQQSQPIPSDYALEILQSYLSLSEKKENVHLLPNATLSSTGPVSKGAQSTNLTIHNLKRVEAGLRGEWLAPSLELEGEAGLETSTTTGGGGSGGKFNKEKDIKIAEVEGWQDLDEYQREQSIENGEVGPELTEVGQEGENMMDVDVEVEVGHIVVDKEARKRAKKAKKDQEKKNRVNQKKN
jgi:hypothetical protein